ncbi:ribosome biogenesis protein, G-patch domain, PINX1 family Pxr1 [Schizosaccharomyces osmophilus]|uniref:PinX1-related protein 1 n=1 Tax=Schizosaccharomyces osmophilus TaxID=2545709 RepID=A0AAE9WC11_9SCHI|nr:ribosome biogenesis protein, G-patch domain, PINX1 family Pxr1 [Schizosaccharomyces osmophilus]WBW73526.1 ribosome biogenesis protein, G-patch domain, PINX1 family Pxr1 [Schizosaccharomyces osmophilus]
MGLAGNKAKQQIGADPRNSRWAKNKDRKGFKLLASYGWQDGNGLGQQQHGRIHNIKVSLKDDTLGIGAKPSNDTEWSGLGEFNAIFGRLNGDENAYGMSAEKARHRKQLDQRQDAEAKNLRSLELARRFVLGGTFTSEFTDWMKKAAEDENRIAEASSDDENSGSSEKESKKKKKEKKSKHSSSSSNKKEEKTKHLKKDKKDSKDKKKEKKDSSKKKSSTKSDKKEKEEKKLKRKRKHASSSASSDSEDEDADTKSSSRKKPTNVHFHTRRKFLAQKRAAVSDPTALREILGIKG